MDIIIGLLILVLGVALCFWGNRFFRILMPILAFIAGFWIGEALIALVLGDGNAAIIIGWLIGLVGGLVLAGLAFLIPQAAEIILGAAFGWWLASGLLTWLLGDQGMLNLILIVLAAILFAGLTFLDSLRRYLLPAYTALLGASAIASGFLFMFGSLDVEMFRSSFTTMAFVWQESWAVTIFWLLLAVVGFGIQLINTREVVESSEMSEEISELDSFVEVSDQPEGEELVSSFEADDLIDELAADDEFDDLYFTEELES